MTTRVVNGLQEKSDLCYMKDCFVRGTCFLFLETYCFRTSVVRLNCCVEHELDFQDVLLKVSNTNKAVSICFNLDGIRYLENKEIEKLSLKDTKLLIAMLERLYEGISKLKSLIKTLMFEDDISLHQILFDRHSVKTNIRDLLDTITE